MRTQLEKINQCIKMMNEIEDSNGDIVIFSYLKIIEDTLSRVKGEIEHQMEARGEEL